MQLGLFEARFVFDVPVANVFASAYEGVVLSQSKNLSSQKERTFQALGEIVATHSDFDIAQVNRFAYRRQPRDRSLDDRRVCTANLDRLTRAKDTLVGSPLELVDPYETIFDSAPGERREFDVGDHAIGRRQNVAINVLCLSSVGHFDLL